MAKTDYDRGYEDGEQDGYAAGQNGHFGGCGAPTLRAMDPEFRTGYMAGYEAGNARAEADAQPADRSA